MFLDMDDFTCTENSRGATTLALLVLRMATRGIVGVTDVETTVFQMKNVDEKGHGLLINSWILTLPKALRLHRCAQSLRAFASACIVLEMACHERGVLLRPCPYLLVRIQRTDDGFTITK